MPSTTFSEENYEWLLSLASKRQLKEKKNISINDIITTIKKLSNKEFENKIIGDTKDGN